jgi:ACS family hexuronate transporter-like MFS transporter
MIALLMTGSIINYLTRSTLAVAAPTLLADLHITPQQYSWILGAFTGAIMMQPLCGYVLDVLGLKRGFAIFAIAWSLISMAHALVHNWQALFGLRGLLGLAEGSANPAGMKATSLWFPAKERGFAGGLFNIGASVGSMLAPPLVAWAILVYSWPFAFVLTGALGLVWVVLWLSFYDSPTNIRRSRMRGARIFSRAREAHLQGTAGARRSRRSSGSATSGASRCRGFWRIHLGHADVLAAALPEHGPAPTSNRLRCSRGCRSSPPIWAAWPAARSARAAALRRRPPDRRAARRVHGGRGPDDADRPGRLRGEPLHGDRVVRLAGFAHQTLSVTVITMSSDLFTRNEVATSRAWPGRAATAASSSSRCSSAAWSRRSVIRRSSSASPSSTSPRAAAVDARPRARGGRMTARIRNPILRGFNPDPRSSASATTTTSPPRPSNGFRASRSTIRAISSTGAWPRVPSIARVSSTCSAIRIRAASGLPA